MLVFINLGTCSILGQLELELLLIGAQTKEERDWKRKSTHVIFHWLCIGGQDLFQTIRVAPLPNQCRLFRLLRFRSLKSLHWLGHGTQVLEGLTLSPSKT